MNVFNACDGASIGQLALKRARVKVDKYLASEIDSFAIQTAKKNFPKTVHVGDLTKVKAKDLGSIDLLLAGPPCQGFSVMGKRLNLDDPRSQLFFKVARLIKTLKPKYFLVENVIINPEVLPHINKIMKCEPIEVDSRNVSCQQRRRYYWTNIPGFVPPKDRNILMENVIGWSRSTRYRCDKTGKVYSHKAPGRTSFIEQRIRYNGKTNTLVTGAGCNAFSAKTLMLTSKKSIKKIKSFKSEIIKGVDLESLDLRPLTPDECEFAQTLPIGYTSGVSDSQRYKQIGNGWTLALITEFFKAMKKDMK